jgi:hypothetical protein
MQTDSLSVNGILRNRDFACCDRSFWGMKLFLLGFWKNSKSAQTMWTSPLQLMQMVK